MLCFRTRQCLVPCCCPSWPAHRWAEAPCPPPPPRTSDTRCTEERAISTTYLLSDKMAQGFSGRQSYPLAWYPPLHRPRTTPSPRPSTEPVPAPPLSLVPPQETDSLPPCWTRAIYTPFCTVNTTRPSCFLECVKGWMLM